MIVREKPSGQRHSVGLQKVFQLVAASRILWAFFCIFAGFMLARLGPIDAETWNMTPQSPGDFVKPVFENFKDDKLSHRSYSILYSKYLRDYRQIRSSLLEIGVGCVNKYSYGPGHGYTPGRSVKVWRQILPLADITVLDIDECALELHDMGLLDKRSIFVGSQIDTSLLSNVVSTKGPFEVIIDDGSHVPEHQLNTFYHLFTKGLKPGGVYVIEDLESSIRRDDVLVNGTFFRMGAELSVLLTHQGKVGQNIVPGNSKVDNDLLQKYDIASMVESVDWFEDAIVVTKKSM